ncbi:MAG: uroporphyrinogen-III synthase [Colwellia sp.]|nr:uroporphyrinogen-III synthase [Colwellia sp.]
MLITRPEDKGRQLALQLKTIGITTTCQSFFDYHGINDQNHLQRTLKSPALDIVIFVSVAAVNFANQVCPISTWVSFNMASEIKYFAVGQATKQALSACSINQVIAPKQQNSEGLLALVELLNVNNKNILIVRGDGGREYLKEVLEQRGAQVNYLESYQRLWRTFNSNVVKQWQDTKINAIVITSNALLQRIVDIISAFTDTLTMEEKLTFDLWFNACLWVVASERIAKNAKALGLCNIVNANGANDQAIINALN